MDADVGSLVPRRQAPGRGGAKAKLLLVDDEPAVLSALSRHLRAYYAVETAEGGEAAVAAAASSGPFAVVMTDMRMPGMDGVAVLKHMRDHYPDTVRMLLTGYADLESAMAAVNDGNVFRFLTKPSTPETVRAAMEAAVHQYDLVQAERELLEGTLQGSVRALLETLSLANPAAFGRASRVKGIVAELLDNIEVGDRWEVEVAAMLSQVGAVTLPPKVVEKLHRGAPLDEDETDMVSRLPDLADRLLQGIPRLDGVRDIIRNLKRWKVVDAPIGSKLIQLALDFDVLEAREVPLDVAVQNLKDHAIDYGEEAMKALVALRADGTAARTLREVDVAHLEVGMVLAADIRTREGMLLVSRGFAVTEGVLERIRNFSQSSGLESEVVTVVVDR